MIWFWLLLAAAAIIFVVVMVAYEAYAAGWNASASYHRNRPKINGKPNPFWREYR